MKRYHTLFFSLVIAFLGIAYLAYAQDEAKSEAKKEVAPSATSTPALAAVKPMDDPRFKKLEDKVSYVIGLNIGANLKRQFLSQGIAVNNELLQEGFNTAITGNQPKMTGAQMQAVMAQFQEKMKGIQAQKQALQATIAEKNKAQGEAYLKSKAKEEGVVTLPSGLLYKIITPGKGVQPAATQKVRVHYQGTLIDGTEFDSSYKRGQPAEFPVNGVIKGWVEALQLMTVGSKWQLFIPSSLAYGDNGPGNIIQPGSTLIFEVELMAIIQDPKPQDTKTP